MYLLDTNVCIDFLGGKSEALARKIEANFGRLFVSTITAAELLVGSKISQDPAGDSKKIDIFITAVKRVDFDLAAARAYGQLIRDIGVQRKSFDRLIGVQAVHRGMTLITRNGKHFADVPGLRVENWTI